MTGQGTDRLHTRLLAFPDDQSPPGGRLDALALVPRRHRTDLVMDYHELQLTSPSTLFEHDGRRWEQVQAVYRPRRLRFTGAHIVEGAALCVYLDDLPADHLARDITSALAWCSPDGRNYYLFGVRVAAEPSLLLIARSCLAEPVTGVAQPSAAPAPTSTLQAVSFARGWSTPPLSPARLVPNPRALRARYGGDPITIRLDDRLLRRRLFIGGVDVQGEQRPDVHVVLNVGEEPSRWAATGAHHSTDRWENKGEGSQGMDVDEIAREARWVIERLRAGQRVLVHCAAGMNRSATICCAVLILLEGLPTEEALVRVREHHPWARPDPRHWLELRWLAHTM